LTTDGAKVLVNFRLPPGLVEEMDQAASRAGLNRTEWVKSILTLAARQELNGAAMAVAVRVPPAALQAPAGVPGDGCAHPKAMRAWVEAGLVCLACRTVLQRQSKGA
jgi:hypothetical protein